MGAHEREFGLECLLGYDLQTLKHEPCRLEEQQKQNAKCLKSLIYNNYSCFLDLHSGISELRNNYSTVVNDLTSISSAKLSFPEVFNFHRYPQTVLKNYSIVLQFLEIPKTIENAINNELYDEAIEIISKIHRVQKNANHSFTVLSKISEEVESLFKVMLNKIIEKLSTQFLDLPTSIQLISLLRRTRQIDDNELRLTFLKARGTPLDKCSEDVNVLINLSRSLLFDTITQYRALFAHNDLLLRSWIIHRLSVFLDALRVGLKKHNNLDVLFMQAMNFSSSMSRFGADIRPLIIDCFEEATISRWKTLLPHRELTDMSIYCAEILKAFNEIKSFCPLSIIEEFRQCLNDSIANLVENIISTRICISEEKARERCVLFETHFAPFINSCLKRLFPTKTLAQALGVSARDIPVLKANYIDFHPLLMRLYSGLGVSREIESTEKLPRNVVVKSSYGNIVNKNDIKTVIHQNNSCSIDEEVASIMSEVIESIL